MSESTIDATTITAAYIEARRMAYQWYRGAGMNNPTTQRCYDARLDALQDMMDVLEQKTGMDMKMAGKRASMMLIDDPFDPEPVPSFTEQIINPIKQRMKNEE